MQELLQIDESAVQEHFFEAGWTDGLPIVPPTPDRVLETLLAAGVSDPQEIIGSVPQRGISVTVEQLAINAVMAGCKPGYFPVVLSAAECLLDPTFNAHTACTSTGGAALCVLVSGPLAAELGMNGGLNALGPGNRANATIGRALRLMAANVLDARSGALDGSSLGHPGKYTLCFAEEPPPEGFAPHRVAMGYDEADTTVTLMPTEGPHQIANHMNGDPEGVLRTFAAAMSNPATFSTGKNGQGIVVLGWEHRMILIRAGWTRSRIQAFLHEHTRVTPEQLAAAGIPLEEGSKPQVPDADGRLASFRSPEDIYVVTAGGAGAGWSAYIPSWAPPLHAHAEAVTRRVRPPGEALPECGTDGCEVTF